MDPQIADFYNDEPHMVHVINQLNAEYEEAMKTIVKLRKENIRLKERTLPPEIPDDDDVIEAFERKISDTFLEWCEGDLGNYEPLSTKLMDDYKSYNNPSYKNSLIKQLISDLNDLTGKKKPKWCELMVLSTLESVGITDSFPYWGAPMFEVENLIGDLCHFELPLLSVKNM